MKIGIIERYNSEYSNLRRRNRNAEWEWDVRHEYEYDFYSDLKCLSEDQYKIIHHYLTSLVRSEVETVESDHRYDTTQMAYVVEQSQSLADKLRCQIFTPYETPINVYKHTINPTYAPNSYYPENPDYSEESYKRIQWESYSVKIDEVQIIPEIRYIKLTKEKMYYDSPRYYWKGMYKGRNILLDEDKDVILQENGFTYKTSILNADFIYPTYNEHSFNGLKNTGNSKTYKYAAVRKEDTYGVITLDGELVLKHQRYEICEVYDNFCVVKNEGNFSCLGFSGELLMPFTNKDFIIHDNRYVEVIYDDFKLVYDMRVGRLILNASYKNIDKFTENCIFVNVGNRQIDVYNHNFLRLNSRLLDYADDCGEGIITGIIQDRCVAIDYNGNVLLDDIDKYYTAIKAIDSHIRLLKKKPNSYYIHGLADQKGNIIFPCNSDAPIKIFKSNNEFYYILRKYKKDRLYNKHGQALSADYDIINKEHEGICVAFNGEYYIKDKKIKIVKGTYYAINLLNQVLFNLECQFLYQFKNGFATFRKGNKFGKIDINGNIIIPPLYDGLGNVSYGMIAAKVNDKWGYIDIDGNRRIDFNFDRAEDFNENEVAYVEWAGESTIINKNGEYLEDWKEIPGYDECENGSEGWSGYTADELEEMYRDAMGGDPANEWNID